MKDTKKTWPAAVLSAPFAACVLFTVCMSFSVCASVDSESIGASTARAASGAAEGWGWRAVNSAITIPLYSDRQETGPGMSLTYRLLDLPGSGKEAQTLRELLYDGNTPEKYRNKSGETLRNEYFNMKETAEGYPGMAESLNWFYTETVECGAESPRYAVIRRDREYYLGGPHGMRETKYFLIGRDGTGPVSLDRFIKEGAAPALMRLAEEEIRRHFDIAEGRPLTDVLFEDHLAVQDNFFPGPGGLGFHWDPYEIAPYSAGPVDLSIPWARCADLLGGEGLRIAGDFGFL